jgi:CheY-like chemotaxis protein
MSDDITICFSVRDTGIGIRPEDIEKVFEVYTQLDSGADRRAEGTGLGLSISKKLAKAMNGSISVESEHGKGSIFTVQIIQKQTDTGTIGDEAASNLRNLKHHSSFLTSNSSFEHFSLLTSPLRRCDFSLLVVDDIPENLTAIKKMLAPYGIIVDTALSGMEGIKKLKVTEYDLIFMDHMMPEMDGIETFKKIRNEQLGTCPAPKNLGAGCRNGKRTPIVMLTASAMSGVKEYYLEQGLDDYLSKPVNAKELDDILRRWLSSEQLEACPAPKFLGAGCSNEQFKDHCSLNNHYRLALEISEQQKRKLEKESQTLSIEHEQITDRILPQLKEAFMSGNLEKAETIITEMGSLDLSQSDRNLYYKLHNCILTADIEKALELL